MAWLDDHRTHRGTPALQAGRADRAQRTAEQSVLAVSLRANTESHVRVVLDSVRFPPEDNASGLGNLARQSLDAPNDDRLPLFQLQLLIAEAPEGDR